MGGVALVMPPILYLGEIKREAVGAEGPGDSAMQTDFIQR